jgi:hypothetical protein
MNFVLHACTIIDSCTQDCSRVLVLPAHILYSTVTTFYDDARVTDEYGKIGVGCFFV